MLTIRDLSFSYGRISTLKNVSMDLAPGQVTCIFGPNGAGKTTLLNAIMGLLGTTSGSVTLDGEDLTPMSGYQRCRQGLALVPQGRRIFPKLSVRENLRVGLDAFSGRRNGIPNRVFEFFPDLKDILGRAGGHLSGGQQQQLAIARALVTEPKVLLLDEPTEGIQPNIKWEIGALLRRLAEQEPGGGRKAGTMVVLVEQNLGFIKECGDWFYYLDHGIAGRKRPIEELSRSQSHGKVNLNFGDEYL